MSDQIITSAPGAKTSRPQSRVLVRSCVFGIVGILTIAVLVIGVRWGWYRHENIVLREAAVKGVVAKIGARIEGRIESIEVEPGQVISKGQLLLKLEDRHLLAALERARAELQSAIADLDSEKMDMEETRRRLSLEVQHLSALRKKAAGELEAEQSNLETLAKDYARSVSLVKDGIATSSEMDRVTGDRNKSQAMVKAANGTLDAADFSHQKAKGEIEALRVRQARLAVLESQIAVARARVATCEADLEATVIRASENGRVLDRILEVGGSAKVGEPLISLWIGRSWVEAWADEKDLGKIKIGSQVDVILDAAPDRKLSGRVESIGALTDKQLQPTPVPSTLHAFLRRSAMVPVRITLEGNDSEIQLGLSAVVGIRKEARASEPNFRTLLSSFMPWNKKKI